MGALYHPPGGIIRHDAVVWGYARGADAGGVEIHPYTEVTGLDALERRRITAVQTNRGTIKAGQVVNCTAGWSIADLRHGRRASCRSPPTSCRPA